MRNLGFSWVFHCPILYFSFYRVATLIQCPTNQWRAPRLRASNNST